MTRTIIALLLCAVLCVAVTAGLIYTAVYFTGTLVTFNLTLLVLIPVFIGFYSAWCSYRRDNQYF